MGRLLALIPPGQAAVLAVAAVSLVVVAHALYRAGRLIYQDYRESTNQNRGWL